jgi:hypothetical protein
VSLTHLTDSPLSLSLSFDIFRISRVGKPGRIVNILRNSDGTVESLDVKYLSSGEVASVLNPSLVKPYHSKFLRNTKAESVEEMKTEEKHDTEKSSEKLDTTEEQEESLEKQETEAKQDIEKSSAKLETTKKQEKSPEKQETEAEQEPAEKQDNAGLTRQALKFVERRQARRNLSPRSSRRRMRGRRISRPLAPPKDEVEPETNLEAELEIKPEADLESKLEADLASAEAEFEQEFESKPEAKPEAELESKLEIKLESSEAQLESKRSAELESQPEEELEPEPEAELESKLETNLESSKVESESKPEAEPETKLEAEPETKLEAKVESSEGELESSEGELESTDAELESTDAEDERKPEAEIESSVEGLENKQDEAILDAELTTTKPSISPRLASTPDCMKYYEAEKHTATSVPVSTPDFMKKCESEKNAAVSVTASTPDLDFMMMYESEKNATVSVPGFTPEFLKSYEAERDVALSVPADLVLGDNQTNGINCENLLELVSESEDLLKGTNTQKNKYVPADEILINTERHNSAIEDEIPMNRSAEEPFPCTPQRSMETKVDTSWVESPCPIFTPKRLLYQDETPLAQLSHRDITPLPTRRVNGQVMYDADSPSVEIRALLAPTPASTPPRSKNETSFETSSVVSTPRKNNTSQQDATLDTLEGTDCETFEDTDYSGETEDSASIETGRSETSAPTEDDTDKENEEISDAATKKIGNTAGYLHTLLVGDSYSLDTAGESYSLSIDTDQSMTDNDMDQRSTCSEALPRSKKMERESHFDFCSSDTMNYEFSLVAKLLASSGALFSSTDGCPPEGCTPKPRFSKRSARRADTISPGNSMASFFATEGLGDSRRSTPRPKSNGSNEADQHSDRRFAC